MDAEALERRSSARKKEGFEKWLDDPMVRMTLSTIPAGERADTLKLTLQSAFDRGFGCGASDMMGTMVETILSSKKERHD